MAELLVKGVMTENGEAKIDYRALANRPDGEILRISDDLKAEIKRATDAENALGIKTAQDSNKLGGQLPSYYAESSHVHGAASTTNNGFMSKEDKAKLNGIAEGANKITVDSQMSTTSTNPVQNKIVNAAIEAAKTSAANAQSTADAAMPKANFSWDSETATLNITL